MSAPRDSPETSSLLSWLATLGADEMQAQTSEASEEMRQAQSIFKSLVDSLPLNLLIKDAAGRRVFANRSYLDSHHKTLAEIAGKTDFDLFPAEWLASSPPMTSKSFVTGRRDARHRGASNA